jgi:hypothetical protein
VLTDFIRWIRDQLRRGAPSIWPRRVAEPPDNADAHVVYLIGDTPAPWCASLRCPCGCGETISLSLIPEDRPKWRARTHFDGTISLHPSIWRTKGCRSHFFIVRSRIIWVPSGRY